MSNKFTREELKIIAEKRAADKAAPKPQMKETLKSMAMWVVVFLSMTIMGYLFMWITTLWK